MGKPMFISIQKLFAVIITLKIISSVLGWMAGSPWVLGFIVPLALMAVYIFIGMNRPDEYELSDDKFADTCYYLGFIFTISSILVSLFDLNQIGTKLNEIAVRFGAAMVSTVLGLIVRVYLVNFKMDTHDVTKFMENDLFESAKTFRIHMELAVEKLKQFNLIVEDASKSAITKVNIGIQEAAGEYANQFTDLFTQISANNRQASDEAVMHIRDISEDVGKMLLRNSEALSGSLKQFELRMVELSASLSAIANDSNKSSIAKINKNIEDLSAGYQQKFSSLFESIVVKSNRITEEALQKINFSTEDVGNALSKYSENLMAGMKQFEARLVETTESLNHRLKNMTHIEKDIARYSTTLATSAKQFEERLAVTTESLESRMRNMAHIEKNISKFSAALASSVEPHVAGTQETPRPAKQQTKPAVQAENEARKPLEKPAIAPSPEAMKKAAPAEKEPATPVGDPVNMLRNSVDSMSSEVTGIVGEMKTGVKSLTVALDAASNAADKISATTRDKAKPKDQDKVMDKMNSMLQQLEKLQ